MVTKVKTGKSRTKRRTKAFAAAVMGKPSGQIQERVKQAGPEHFGVVSVDCAKDRSKWMLADFYGRVLIPPTSVEHRRSEIQLALLTLKQAVEKHGIKDTIVAVEMTGTYHQIIWRAFRTAGYDTRIVQPVALKVLQYIAEHGGTHQALLDVGIPGVSKWLKQQNVAFQSRSVGRIVAWAGNAVVGDPMRSMMTRIWQSLLIDWQQKTQQIIALERDIASLLVQTPWVLLMSHPGINVVSAAELAAETGPIEHYASSKAITGRAGLFPSRYQSDGVDRGGNLSRFRNARMRGAWLLAAECLLKCNDYWRGKFNFWKTQGHDSRDIRVRIANRFTRTVFQMVAGRKVFNHRSRLDRSYILDKLLTFHREHDTPMAEILTDLKSATDQLPKHAYADEAKPLQEVQRKSFRSRRNEPQQLGTLLVGLLARLGVTIQPPALQSVPLEAPAADSDKGDR